MCDCYSVINPSSTVCQHYRSRDDTEAQRLDHLRSGRYNISGNPINVETNIIETVTPEEYIETLPECFRLRKGIGMWYGK